VAIEVGRVGVWLSSRLFGAPNPDPALVADTAAQVEELGYGALWIGSATGDLKLVAGLLEATTRLVVATGIVNVWTEPAATTAAAYARLSRACPGRLLLGIGAGHKSSVEATTGQRYERPYHKLVEYLDVLDGADPPVPVDGRVLAALGPRVLGLARDRTAGAHPYLMTPEHSQQARAILGDAPLLAPEQTVVLATDPERARAVARATLRRYLALPNYTRNWQRLGFTDEDIAGEGSDRLVDALIAWGDAATIADRVTQQHRAGADHVCVQVLTSTGEFPLAELRELAPALLGG
jgi:probable F420-dependent oxidoreductase